VSAEEEVVALEKQFWYAAGDADFYRDNLTETAIMVFPSPYGIMDRDRTIAAVEAAQPWVSLEMTEVQFVPLTETSALVAYRASARRADGPAYNTFAASAYVKEQGAWKLAVHQQTPIPEAG
jgi:hypothetical protein